MTMMSRSLTAFFVVLALCVPASAQWVDSVYHYPILPGTHAWSKLSEHNKMTQACQIPEPILRSMPTLVLIRSCLDYPLFNEYDVWSTPQEGMNMLLKNFNGLQELYRRNDAGKSLLEYYETLDPLGYDTTWEPIRKGEYKDRILFTEVILSQDTIINQMTHGERSRLIRESLSKLHLKRQRIYGRMAGMICAGITGKIMKAEGHKKFLIYTEESKLSNSVDNVSEFLQTGRIRSQKTIGDIIKLAEEFSDSVNQRERR